MAKPSPDNSEWLTRKLLIDKVLRAAGWRVTPHAEKPLSKFDRCAVEEFPTSNGPADYALVMGGIVVGVVEAKKLSLGPQNVLSQAERYSNGVDGVGSWGEFGVPFLYSTNGEVIWYHDVRHEHNRSRVVAGFHTPEALGEYLGRDDDATLARLAALPNDGSRLRSYPDRLFCARLKNTQMNEYVELCFASAALREELTARAKSSAGHQRVSISDITGQRMQLPPLGEQQEIMRRTRAVFALADRLETRYGKAKTQVDKLPQSVLAKAFRGELVPIEAELARREGREYETAEELLARIKQGQTRATHRVTARHSRVRRRV